ncbi:hypothetical protein HPP92_007170 [Vanilla planifolia]|uniref:CRM domain-containing protein n=1 Tax=Vanilla planifolia TaxID=51239 RepID=A0A835RQV2_VANPL|nr:hypothetical protein HPP92_007170 [Vanilla planifolia]
MALASTVLRPLVRFPSLCSSIRRVSFYTCLLPFHFSSPSPTLFLSHLFSSSSSFSVLTASSNPTLLDYQSELLESELPDDCDLAAEDENLLVEKEEDEAEPLSEKRATKSALLPSFPTPKLTVKEKKELASYAHSLGKKLKFQQVGKSGVTPAIAAAMVEALEANELLKLKVHGSCPEEMNHAIQQLESATGSAAVDQIGRTVILYRPSLSKIKKDADRKIKQQLQRPSKSSHASKVQKRKTFS